MINTYKQIIIVEGRSDTQKLQNVFGDIKTIETGGSSISHEVIEQIKSLSDQELVVFTDPDFQGERIRKIITEIAPNVQHAFLTKDQAKPDNKGKLGIEHANFADIKSALENSLTPIQNSNEIKIDYLRELGLIDETDSFTKRQKIANKLGIGQVNGKQFLKRLNLFNISSKRLKDEVEKND